MPYHIDEAHLLRCCKYKNEEVHVNEFQSGQIGFPKIKFIKFGVILNLGQHIAAGEKKNTCSLSFQNLVQRLKDLISGIASVPKMLHHYKNATVCHAIFKTLCNTYP